MKALVISDIHIEFPKNLQFFENDFAWPNDNEYDVLIAAGDIGTGLNGINFLNKKVPNKPIIYVPGNTPIYVSDIKSYGIHIQIQAGKDDWYFYFKVEGYNTDSNQWDTIPGYENHICDDYHHTGGLHTEDNQPDGLRDWF